MFLLPGFMIAAAVALDLSPPPKLVEVGDEAAFELQSGTPVVVSDNAAADDLEVIVESFQELGIAPKVVPASKYSRDVPAVYVGDVVRHASFRTRALKRVLADLSEPGPQGYRLLISRRYVLIAGTDAAGTYYGLRSFLRLAKTSLTLPEARIRDEPDLAIRGVVTDTPLGQRELRKLAELRCNMVLFQSPDFLQPTPEAEQKWRTAFADARRYHIEPVPEIGLLGGSEPLLRERPELAEARVAIDRVQLSGDNWALFPRHNVLYGKGSPVLVTLGEHVFAPDVDFALDISPAQVPYDSTRGVGLIRRVEGGAIPDGATVEVAYSYVPPGTQTCCLTAPETKAAWQHALKQVVDWLDPRWVHIGGARLERLNTDLRCLRADKANAEVFAQAMDALEKAAKAANPELRLMLSANVLHPEMDGGRLNLSGVAADLSTRLALTLSLPDNGDRLASGLSGSLAWARGLPFQFIGVSDDNALHTYRWCEELTTDSEKSDSGLLVTCTGTGDSIESASDALEKAWSTRMIKLAWPEGLNDYFHASLYRPSFEELRASVIAHTNRQTLAGIPPADELKTFRTALETVRARLPEGELETGEVERLDANVIEYLEIEAAYRHKPSESLLRRLPRVVEAQAKLDPNLTEERIQKIVETIQSKGLFVPSTILFGEYVLPYRVLRVPSGHAVLEVIANPEFHDTERRAEAVYDLLTPPGPVCRVDFETVGAARLRLEKSDTGAEYVLVQEWTSGERGGIHAPVIPDSPVRSRFLRIAVEAPAEAAVLRNPRLSALKGPAAAAAPRTLTAPVLDASFREGMWPVEAQVDGFVLNGRPAFAEAQTNARLCCTAEALYVGAYAREPRMKTMAAGLAERDAPVWTEESLEFLLDTGEGLVRFVVNPLGTRFDSRADDAEWDGEWQAVTKDYGTGWAVEMAVPFKTLGRAPGKGESWKMNIVRHRNNVKKETSSWAYRADDASNSSEFGKLVFE
ncbi:MAG: hypothetical protein HY706_03320 [Candidatus Hydrogenedentes bacterium]|nr:hypothetical protein [Candidatus Hydrogenedentota bacterium]